MNARLQRRSAFDLELHGSEQFPTAVQLSELVADQKLRASQLQHELDTMRSQPPRAAGQFDVGRFLKSIPSFQPELQDMEGYLAGKPQKAKASPVRRVAVQPVSTASAHEPAPPSPGGGEDWRAKATALMKAADNASAAALALTTTAEAIAARMPAGEARRRTAPAAAQPEPEPVPSIDSYYRGAPQAPGPPADAAPPARPTTSHGRGRRPNAMQPPMIANDEYDEDLRRIAQYEKLRGPIESSTVPLAKDLPAVGGLSWHDEQDDRSAEFTMVAPSSNDEDENADDDEHEDGGIKFVDGDAEPPARTKPPSLSVMAAAGDDGDGDVTEEPGLGQVSPGTPPSLVVQAWRDDAPAPAPAPLPAAEPVVAKAQSPARRKAPLANLGVTTQVNAVIESSGDVPWPDMQERADLLEQITTLKKRLAAERRARVATEERETVLLEQLHKVRGAMPPTADDDMEVARFYAVVAPSHASTDKPHKVVHSFYQKAHKGGRGADWRLFMCEQLAERWGQPAFDLLDRLGRLGSVSAADVASMPDTVAPVKVWKTAADPAVPGASTSAKPGLRYQRPKAESSKGKATGKPKPKGRKSSGRKSRLSAPADPWVKNHNRPGEPRRRPRGQREIADEAAAKARPHKPSPEGLFFGGFSAEETAESEETAETHPGMPKWDVVPESPKRAWNDGAVEAVEDVAEQQVDGHEKFRSVTGQYPGRQVLERLSLDLQAEEALGAALLGSTAASMAAQEAPIDAPPEEQMSPEPEPKVKQPEPEPEPGPEPELVMEPGAGDGTDLHDLLGDLMGALRVDPKSVLENSGALDSRFAPAVPRRLTFGFVWRVRSYKLAGDPCGPVPRCGRNGSR